MALDKFFCKVADTKANDKSIEFPSEKEAIEYCKENGINPHKIILMGDKYIIKTKDSNYRTTMDEAISACDMKASYKVEKSRFDGKFICYFLVDGRTNKDERGTDGTGLKLYDSEDKAEAAGKRYLAKMKRNGFEV